jgi:hypothetical protein
MIANILCLLISMFLLRLKVLEERPNHAKQGATS